jgi:hypothetical protein
MTDPRCLAWFLGLLLCWSAACGPAPSAEVHAARCVAIDVKRDDGTPLPGVAVRLGDGDALRTGVDGQVLVSLRPISSHVEVRAECPVGYRPSSARRLDLGPWTATERLSISFTCRPNQRSLGVAVLAPRAAGHAVLVDGLPIGQVAGDGTFHAVVERAPGTRLRVEPSRSWRSPTAMSSSSLRRTRRRPPCGRDLVRPPQPGGPSDPTSRTRFTVHAVEPLALRPRGPDRRDRRAFDATHTCSMADPPRMPRASARPRRDRAHGRGREPHGPWRYARVHSPTPWRPSLPASARGTSRHRWARR